MSAADAGDVFAFPLSYAQQRLWFMDQLVPNNPLFNLNTAVRFHVHVDVDVLARSIAEIARRHEALRTVFGVLDDQPVQIVSPTRTLRLNVVDLRTSPHSEWEEHVARLVAADAAAPFDLARGPLVRTTLFQLGEHESVLSLTMHHIVSDGWSLGLFWQELSALWPAFAAGRPSSLPDLPIQYGDYAVWQHEFVDGILDEQLAYWRRQLQDVPVLDLPTDRPRPAVQSFAGATYPLAVDPQVTSALREVGRGEGATLYMTLLTAFFVLLVRYTGQEDVVVGSYIAGRNRPELEPIIGFFLNSLVLRADVTGNPTFRQALAGVRRLTLDAYAHQDVPFAKLVEELQPERDLSRNPLFQVVFQMINVPTLTEAEGQQASLVEVDKGTSIFDLTFSLWESGNGLRGHFEYSTDLFDTETIARLAAHFLRLLSCVVADPDARIADLQLLTDEEEALLVTEWNTTSKERELPSIPELFSAVAQQRPEETSFLYGDNRLTFGELRHRSRALARHLRALGVDQEVLVGIHLDRSFDFVAALLAVFEAGGAYLPLDPSYPAERLRFMLEDSDARVLLAKGTCEELSVPGVEVVDIDGVESMDEDPVGEGQISPPALGQLAYVMYTSGSTGKPKGVAVTHAQLLNRLAWMWETYPFLPGEVGCQKTALNFVDSIWELLGPMLQGVPTVIVPDPVLRDPHQLVDTLAGHGVTRIWVVPSFLRMLLDAFPDLRHRVPELTFWVTSGEAISRELFDRFSECMPQATLHNVYGTSEVWDATWYDPNRHGPPTSRVPIGRPISNVEVYVLDRYGSLVPIGVAGELFVGGVGLARGYLNRPELTERKFVTHPYSTDPSARLYRTGDVVRYRPDGNIEFLTRTDHQVKLRGFRVELGEIEAVLAQHPSVQQAVVTVQQEPTSPDRSLAAHVVPREQAAPAAAELRAFLRTTLPEHMVPASFVVLDSIPLTPNGKTNREALRAKTRIERLAGDPPHLGPRSDAERLVAAIWEEVLGVRVGVEDNFFDLGGHSLLLFHVYTRLRGIVDDDLSMTDLFRYPTIASLAAYLADGALPDTFTRARKRAEEPPDSLARRPAGRV